MSGAILGQCVRLTQLLVTHWAATLCNNAQNKSPWAASQCPHCLMLHTSCTVLLDNLSNLKRPLSQLKKKTITQTISSYLVFRVECVLCWIWLVETQTTLLPHVSLKKKKKKSESLCSAPRSALPVGTSANKNKVFAARGNVVSTWQWHIQRRARLAGQWHLPV